MFSHCQNEARAQVRELLDVPDTLAATESFLCDIESSDADTAKIAEYALFVGPLTQGLEGFLDTHEDISSSFPELSEEEIVLAQRLINIVGAHLFRYVTDAINGSDRLPLLLDLQTHREDLASEGKTAICPGFLDNLYGATFSSVTSMYCIAAVNRSVILDAKDPDLKTKADVIDAVRRSTQLALARPRAHFNSNTGLNTEAINLGLYYSHGEISANVGAIRYDAERKCAVMAVPLPQWLTTPTEDNLDVLTFGYEPDTRVGCPLSFKPGLLKRYYEFMVDVTDLVRVWPNFKDQ